MDGDRLGVVGRSHAVEKGKHVSLGMFSDAIAAGATMIMPRASTTTATRQRSNRRLLTAAITLQCSGGATRRRGHDHVGVRRLHRDRI